MNDQQTQMMIINQAHIMNQPPPPHLPPLPQVMNQQPQLPVQSQLFMLNHGYVGSSNTNLNNNSNNNKQLKPWQTLHQNPSKIGTFGVSKPRSNNNNNNNWKAKKMKQSVGQGSTQGYNPPTLHELQSQNRQKTRKFYPNKKKFSDNGNNNNRFAPYAPRNTTSFIIRAKKSGGIASLVSPCPVTPAVLPTPVFSPSREVLVDMAKEEWGVDGYGSMKGLIRLRSGSELENEQDEEDDDDANGSSESDVEEHVEVERRLDHDLSRFEMIYPNYSGSGSGGDYNNVLENRVDDQDSHIAQLEEENLTLKERLFLMEREMEDMRKRLLFLERQSSNHQIGVCGEGGNEEVVENGSENESENGSDFREGKEHNNEDVCMEECVPNDRKKEEKEEKTIKNEFVNGDMIAEEDGQRKLEKVDDQMDAEGEAKRQEKEAGKGIQ